LHICLVSSSFLRPSPHFPSIWILDSQVLSGANWPDLLSDSLALSNLERLVNWMSIFEISRFAPALLKPPLTLLNALSHHHSWSVVVT
jgi:hypothetical protein